MGLSALAVIFVATGPAMGNQDFAKNCKGCHNGGGNIINRTKTLSKEDLEKNGMNSADAIKNLISKGKPPMPAFGKVLSPEQIDAVANYVLQQAEKGW